MRIEWLFPVLVLGVVAGLQLDSRANTSAPASEEESDEGAPQERLQERLAEELTRGISKLYPGARIVLDSRPHWTRGSASEHFQTVSVLGETSHGEMMFSVTGADGRRDGEGWIGFAAWMPAWVATHRVLPGERLDASKFSTQEVNVAVGQPHELRGVILATATPLTGLEARQTVIEGGMLLSTAVQKTPDLRRGDSVRVQLVSNGLVLSTQGTADEPAYYDGQVHVTASRSKRSLVGKLLKSGVVEVKL